MDYIQGWQNTWRICRNLNRHEKFPALRLYSQDTTGAGTGLVAGDPVRGEMPGTTQVVGLFSSMTGMLVDLFSSGMDTFTDRPSRKVTLLRSRDPRNCRYGNRKLPPGNRI